MSKKRRQGGLSIQRGLPNPSTRILQLLGSLVALAALRLKREVRCKAQLLVLKESNARSVQARGQRAGPSSPARQE